MGLRLAIDFGTATTCVATIRNLASFEPELIPIDGNLQFCDSVVWIDEPINETPLVKSDSKNDRSPLAVCNEAMARFERYWGERVFARGDAVRRWRWEEANRDKAMLLSYFKPELADTPEPRIVSFPGRVTSVFDPESQSSDVTITFVNRVLANPDPDTDDMIAATAALLRRGVEAAVARYQEKVDRLVISIPSFDETGGQEAQAAIERRKSAVKLSRIAEDFGSADFRVTVLGEAEAAGYGLNIVGIKAPFLAVVIDMGAGTTDMALLEYETGNGGRVRPKQPSLKRSIRFAGRNINEALAMALRSNPQMEKTYRAMDDRAWQLLLERDIERMKRALTDAPTNFDIRVNEYDAWGEGSDAEEERRRALYRWIPFDGISLQDQTIESAIQIHFKHWRDEVEEFLTEVSKVALARALPIASIELVGGAFRFAPLGLMVSSVLLGLGMEPNLVRYRDVGDESQTVVARGLARWVSLAP